MNDVEQFIDTLVESNRRNMEEDVNEYITRQMNEGPDDPEAELDFNDTTDEGC